MTSTEHIWKPNAFLRSPGGTVQRDSIPEMAHTSCGHKKHMPSHVPKNVAGGHTAAPEGRDTETLSQRQPCATGRVLLPAPCRVRLWLPLGLGALPGSHYTPHSPLPIPRHSGEWGADGGIQRALDCPAGEIQWGPAQHLTGWMLPASLTFHFLPSKKEATHLCPALPEGDRESKETMWKEQSTHEVPSRAPALGGGGVWINSPGGVATMQPCPCWERPP